jgi:diguanylate cyclase (GGDEF)-like protein
MGSIFHDDNIESFFDMMDKNVNTKEHAYQIVERAVSMIAKEFHIKTLEYSMSEPESDLFPDGISQSRVLYGEDPDPAEEDFHETVYKTLGKGIVVIVVYPTAGYQWSKSENYALDYFCRQIHNLCTRAAVMEMIKHIKAKDFLTGVNSLPHFLAYIEELRDHEMLSDYWGFYFNIHNFKYVNKVFDYEQGDIIMRKYANIVSDYLRSSEMLARIGGDNYVAVIRKENVDRFLELIQSVKIVHQHNHKVEEFIFGATVGISDLRNINTPGDFMVRTSIAYQSARDKDILYDYYSKELYGEVMNHKEIVARFNIALDREEFVVYYQPKVRVDDRVLCGAEALVRWVHNGEVVSPAKFVPILEKDGAVCKLDFYVLDHVCRFLRKSITENRPLTRISVNFSRKHLKNVRLVDEIIGTIDRYGIDHQYIEVELTESEDFQDYAIMQDVVERLHAAGISTSIDDFGTGYSSLNMLKQTKLDVVKIDRSFIPLEDEYPEKEKDMVMFKYLVSIAKALGMITVAEGVETETQLQYLRDVECDVVQGYIFDKPLVEAEFVNKINRGRY